MESTITEEYYPAIDLVWQSLSTDTEITLKLLIENLEDHIIDCYRGELFAQYKRGWIRTVLAYTAKKGIDLVS